MRNYDWGFAPTPRQGYVPRMWPVDREATFGFGGSAAPRPSGGYGGGTRYRGFYDVEYEIHPYDNEIRRAAPGFGGPPARTLHPRGGPDRVTYGGGGYGGYGNEGPAGRGYDAGFVSGGRGEYGGAYPTFGGYPGAGGGMYTGRDRQGGGGRGFGGGYGGRGGYDAGYGGGVGGGGFDRGMGRGGVGGGRPFADAPFLPDEAYRRHPELMAEPHHGDAGYDDVGLDLDDSEIYQAVCRRLEQDRYLDAEQIHLMVNDGVVTLEGEVSDFMEARYAWDDAWETPGVRGVINHLAVRTDAASVSHNDEMPQSADGDTPA